MDPISCSCTSQNPRPMLARIFSSQTLEGLPQHKNASAYCYWPGAGVEDWGEGRQQCTRHCWSRQSQLNAVDSPLDRLKSHPQISMNRTRKFQNVQRTTQPPFLMILFSSNSPVPPVPWPWWLLANLKESQRHPVGIARPSSAKRTVGTPNYGDWLGIVDSYLKSCMLEYLCLYRTMFRSLYMTLYKSFLIFLSPCMYIYSCNPWSHEYT